MATQKDELRKPEPGMWGFFVQHLNKGVQPDLRWVAQGGGVGAI